MQESKLYNSNYRRRRIWRKTDAGVRVAFYRLARQASMTVSCLSLPGIEVHEQDDQHTRTDARDAGTPCAPASGSALFDGEIVKEIPLPSLQLHIGSSLAGLRHPPVQETFLGSPTVACNLICK
jgi:hypothetical protein